MASMDDMAAPVGQSHMADDVDKELDAELMASSPFINAAGAGGAEVGMMPDVEAGPEAVAAHIEVSDPLMRHGRHKSGQAEALAAAHAAVEGHKHHKHHRRRSSTGVADKVRLREQAVGALLKEPDARSRAELLAIWHWVQNEHPKSFHHLFKTGQALNEVVKEVLTELRLVRVAKDTVLFKQGDPEETVFVVLKGRCELRRKMAWTKEGLEGEVAGMVDAHHSQILASHPTMGSSHGFVADSAEKEGLGSLGGFAEPGDFLGQPFTADKGHMHRYSVVSSGADDEEPAELLQIPDRIYIKCTQKLDHCPAALRQTEVDELAAYLRPLALVKTWSDEDVEFLAASLHVQDIEVYDHLADVGDIVRYVTIVLSGAVELSIHNRKSVTGDTIVEFVTGVSYFGEEALLTDDDRYPFHADVRQAGRVAHVPIHVARALFSIAYGAPKSTWSAMDMTAANRMQWRTMRLTGRDHVAGIPGVFFAHFQAPVISFTDPKMPTDLKVLPSRALAEKRQRASELAAMTEAEAAKAAYNDGSQGVFTDTFDEFDANAYASVELADAADNIRHFAKSFIRVRIFVAKCHHEKIKIAHLKDAAYEKVKAVMRRSSVARAEMITSSKNLLSPTAAKSKTPMKATGAGDNKPSPVPEDKAVDASKKDIVAAGAGAEAGADEEDVDDTPIVSGGISRDPSRRRSDTGSALIASRRGLVDKDNFRGRRRSNVSSSQQSVDSMLSPQKGVGTDSSVVIDSGAAGSAPPIVATVSGSTTRVMPKGSHHRRRSQTKAALPAEARGSARITDTGMDSGDDDKTPNRRRSANRTSMSELNGSGGVAGSASTPDLRGSVGASRRRSGARPT